MCLVCVVVFPLLGERIKLSRNLSMFFNQISAVGIFAVVPAVAPDAVNTIMGFVFLVCGLCLLPVREEYRRQHAARSHASVLPIAKTES